MYVSNLAPGVLRVLQVLLFSRLPAHLIQLHFDNYLLTKLIVSKERENTSMWLLHDQGWEPMLNRDKLITIMMVLHKILLFKHLPSMTR